MKARVSAILLALSTFAVAACDRSTKAQPLPPDARPPDGPAASAAPSASASAARATDEPPPIEAGPAEPDASVTTGARARAVLELLAGGEPATRLPGSDVDPGSAFNRSQRDRVAPPRRPTVKPGAVTVTGGFSAEAVERIVRQNYGRFRYCYENALRTKPELAGEIVIQFVIDKTGSVDAVTSKGSAIADADVAPCVARGFRNLSFPVPEKGEVHVTYPLRFNPDG